MSITYNAHCPECLGVIPVSVSVNIAGTVPDSKPGLGFRVEVTDVDMLNVATHKHADPPHASKAVALMKHAAQGLDAMGPGAVAAAQRGIDLANESINRARADMARVFPEGGAEWVRKISIPAARPALPNMADGMTTVVNNLTVIRRPWWKFWA